MTHKETPAKMLIKTRVNDINYHYPLVLEGVIMMESNLKQLRPGERAVIVKVLCQGAVKRRLMDMGVTKGAEVMIQKVAPLGDPIEVNIRGYELTFRKAEAENIIVNR